jgi:hypothetical protein
MSRLKLESNIWTLNTNQKTESKVFFQNLGEIQPSFGNLI